MALRDLTNSLSSLAIICVLTITLVLYYIILAVLSPLKSLPGPFFARFTRLWYLKNVWDGEFDQINIALHKKHGPIVRIAPNEYSIGDAEAIKIIYGHGAGFIKAPWYFASGNADPYTKDLFTDRNPKTHAQNRKKVAALYSMTNLTSMEPQVHECVGVLREKFSELATSKSPQSFDLQHWFQCFAFDTIGLITLNKRFGFLDNGKDKWGLLAALHAYLEYVSHVGVFSELHPILYRIVQKFSTSSGSSRLREFTNEQIMQRLAQLDVEKQDSGDFLTKLLSMHKQNPVEFSMSAVFGTCLTNIGAGSDTTSVSLAGIFYHLIKVPQAMSKLTEEIDQAYLTGKFSSPPTFAETQELPYLQACIKEGLRMHPATGLPLARVVPEQGATIAGQFFPGGTIVGVNSWVAHSNTTVFGNDAGIFRPERWLESPGRSSYMGRYFMSFGSGSRTCIGKNISLMEISLAIPDLIKNFTFAMANPDQPLKTENRWFVKQKNLHCRIWLREDKKEH
ncbi:cytochrome P450 oxidoreductase [Mollisia scopiformis]|uniref:Cytochrome P450 oxidoreductase n=1 Tax=Mollisia scopiformis TaxID=149040 RepID=A0A132BDA3_MOLSC|nr:cytochrome P450 oxidoreductase [Mollisia scopiformis]KUJ10351.1 cytochrome P450 oxidoreductase [Mollisia scopiformis]